MKMKNCFSLFGICTLYILATSFVQTDTPISQTLEDKGGNKSFPEFLSHFEKVNMPFEVNLDNRYQYEDRKIKKRIAKKSKGQQQNQRKISRKLLNTYIPELQHGLFSRSGPPEIMPIARFYPNDKMIGIVYLSYQPFWKRNISNYNLLLFDLKGNLLTMDKKEDSDYQFGFSLARDWRSQTQTFSIDQNGYIKKKEYKNIWKKNVKTEGIKDNEIIAYELIKTERFKIAPNGLIETQKENSIDSHASAH